MYSNLVHSKVDMARLPDAIAGIDGVKRRLTAMRGFKGAYWFQPIDGRGMHLSLWDDEAAAKTAAFAIGSSPAPGVVVERVETRAIIAEA